MAESSYGAPLQLETIGIKEPDEEGEVTESENEIRNS